MKYLILVFIALTTNCFAVCEYKTWNARQERYVCNDDFTGGGWGPSEEERNKQSKIKEVSNLKNQCKELGFKEGSKKFKDCVVELME